MKTICKGCQQPKGRIYWTTNKQGRALYREASGALWRGMHCRSCATDKERMRHRAKVTLIPNKAPSDQS